jgi:hypothetical protein
MERLFILVHPWKCAIRNLDRESKSQPFRKMARPNSRRSCSLPKRVLAVQVRQTLLEGHFPVHDSFSLSLRFNYNKYTKI